MTYTLPSWLMPRLWHQESGGDPNAVNRRTGAFGIGQAMRATAADPGFGVHPFDYSAPDQTQEQKRFSTDYATALYNNYQGDIPKTLAAYNWGPGNVERKGMSRMPAETRNYVANITAGQNMQPMTVGEAANPQMSPVPVPAPQTSMDLVRGVAGTPQNMTPKPLPMSAVPTPEATPMANPYLPDPEQPQGGILPIYGASSGHAPGGLKPGAQGFDWGSGNPLWMALLGMGSGLLSGSNWQEGLGAGAKNMAAMMSQAHKDEATRAQQQFNNLIAAQNLQARQDAQRETADYHKITTQNMQDTQDRINRQDTASEQKTVSALDTAFSEMPAWYTTLTNPGIGRLGQGIQSYTGGKWVDAQGGLKARLETVEGHRFTPEEERAIIPQGSDPPEERVRKMDAIITSMGNRYGTYAATQKDPEAWMASREPMFEKVKKLQSGRPKDATVAPQAGHGPGPGQVEAGAGKSSSTPIKLTPGNEDAEWSQLPKGTYYVGPDGTPRIKQ